MRRDRLGDLAVGLIFAAGGAGIVAHAATLRSMPGMIVGSGLVPAITGALMTLFGLVLAARSALGPPPPPVPAEPDGPKARADPALVPVVYPLAILAGLVALAALVEPLGFVVTGTIFTAFVARLGGAGWIGSALCGAGLTILLYAVFVHALGVPLPRGPLG